MPAGHIVSLVTQSAAAVVTHTHTNTMTMEEHGNERPASESIKPGAQYDAGACVASVKPGAQYDAGAYVVSVKPGSQ